MNDGNYAVECGVSAKQTGYSVRVEELKEQKIIIRDSFTYEGIHDLIFSSEHPELATFLEDIECDGEGGYRFLFPDDVNVYCENELYGKNLIETYLYKDRNTMYVTAKTSIRLTIEDISANDDTDITWICGDKSVIKRFYFGGIFDPVCVYNMPPGEYAVKYGTVIRIDVSADIVNEYKIVIDSHLNGGVLKVYKNGTMINTYVLGSDGKWTDAGSTSAEGSANLYSASEIISEREDEQAAATTSLQETDIETSEDEEPADTAAEESTEARAQVPEQPEEAVESPEIPASEGESGVPDEADAYEETEKQ